MALVVEQADRNKSFAEHEDLWSAILGEVLDASKTKLSGNKSVLVVGHDGSGKSTLISRMKNIEEKEKYHCSGLDYRYIDVDDEDSDEIYRFGVWILHGNAEHKSLLKFAINNDNLRDTAVVLVVDLSRPWEVMSCLTGWTKVLKEHMQSLNIDKNVIEEMKSNIVNQFQGYSEVADDADKSLKEEEKVYLPLGEGILDSNLGIPLIVVGTKSDTFPALEKNHDYIDEHFDFIQQHLRKFCLSYGATLAYTTLKEKKNVDILLRYLLHRLYGFSFKYPASVVEKDTIFIPSGWDTMKKIGILYEHMKYFSPDDAYEERIIKPPSTKAISESVQVVAEDDQIFLSKQQSILGVAKPSVASLLNRPPLGAAAVGGVSAATSTAITNAATAGNNSADTVGSTIAAKVASAASISPRAGGQSPRTNLSSAAPKVPLAIGSTAGATTNKTALSALMKKPGDTAKAGAAAGSSEGVLANFFSSLLNKKSGAGGSAGTTSANTPTPTSPPATTTSASRPTPPATSGSSATSKASSSERASVLVKDLMAKRIAVRQNGNS
ncbi:Cytoplasmic dynein 1 light intermediate chain 1 [Trichoplax sp. H2]|nr:Cytoplasmic dynein 1 light intermediate chain 1 [Trichoplax sp. H2]|eukprot:RDD47242.1 Cytoplasmic dynein 1 light intermediate chain 1 [Trichoplax sp. H2]